LVGRLPVFLEVLRGQGHRESAPPARCWLPSSKHTARPDPGAFRL